MQKILPDSLSDWLDNKFKEDRDMLICLSSIKDVYKGNAVFHWDSINNNGNGNTSEIGKPLIGSYGFSNNFLDNAGNALSLNTYTITGVINGKRNAGADFININDSNVIRETCTSERCALSVGNVQISDIPLKTSYVFNYSTTSDRETLTVFYSDNNGNWEKQMTESALNGPIFSNTANMIYTENNGRPHILSLRIYNGLLSNRDLNHNIKADKKRFGL